MLRDGLQAMFEDGRRGDDRAVFTADALSANDRPPVLRRLTIYLFALIATLAIIYGTLAPFQIDPGRTLHFDLAWHAPTPSDAVANIILYVPVGLLMRLVVRRRGSRRPAEWLLSFLPILAISYLTEVCQTVLAYRVASLTDLYCNAIGAAAGILAAPCCQRILRNQHAWFHDTLRKKTYTAAALAIVFVITIAALMPFDFRPTPAQLNSAFTCLTHTSFDLPWTRLDMPQTPFTTTQLYDKILAAAAYGLLAMLMVFSSTEKDQSRTHALRYALTRTLILAVLLESLQILTISHVADPRDLAMAAAFTCLGAAFASRWLRRYDGRPPKLSSMLRNLVILLTLAVTGRMIAVSFMLAGNATPAMIRWLPLADDFRHSWNALLGSYCVVFSQYLILAGATALWFRKDRRRAHWSCVMAAPLAVAAAGLILAHIAGRSQDTSHLVLASAAGFVAIRVDRALFEWRKKHYKYVNNL